MNGIIIRTTRVKDADLIVDWLIENNVLITTYAAHVQTNRAYPSGLELMNVYELEYTLKADQNMGRLAYAHSIEQFPEIVKDMSAYACACAMFEAISNICPKDAAIFELFRNVLTALAVINTAPELGATVLAWFECFLLHTIGALPNLELCAQCAKPLKSSNWFEQELGFICPECAQKRTNIENIVLPCVRHLRVQSLRTIVQNAVTKNAPDQRRSVLIPTLQFLTVIQSDHGTFRRTKAHQFMAETALHMTDFLGSVQRTKP